MKKCTILLIILIASIVLNVYQYRTYSLAATGPADCISTPGFSSPFEISNVDARGFNEQFISSLTAPDSTTGGIISRSAFEEMFCLDKCNGVAYAFGRDKSGATGPGANGVFIIFEGVNIDYDESERKIISVNSVPGAKKYRSGNWCPPSCMLW